MAELVLGEASIQENYSKELEDGRRLKDWHYNIFRKFETWYCEVPARYIQCLGGVE